MKKMTFALACASTCALFADMAPTATFEGYTLTDGVYTGGLSGLPDMGESGSGNSSSYWLYDSTSSSEDASAVKAYGVGENLKAPAGTSLSGQPGEKYLELSTEGGTLWRSLNTLGTVEGGTAAELGGTVPIGDGLYIDTMVQFTPTEDGGTSEEVTAGVDKLAIWLDVKDNVTNLMVRANSVAWPENLDPINNDACVPQNYVLVKEDGSVLNVEPGSWYRLTVEAISDLYKAPDEIYGVYPAFKIYIDGKLVKCRMGENDPVPYNANFISGNIDSETGVSYLTDPSAIEAGKVFPSLVGIGLSGAGSAATLQAVGFKGSGAIDDLVFTTEVTFGEGDPTTYDFTVTAAEGTTVKWATSNTESTQWTDYKSGAKAPAGKVYIQLTDANDVTKVVEQTVASSGENAFDVSTAFGWADYLGAAVEGGAYVIDDEAELVLFQKGCALFATAGETFTLADNIELKAPWAGIGVYNTDNAFKGTFDGNGKTISGVTFTDNNTATGENAATSEQNNYRGFFNQITDATVKNLTINGTGFATTPSTTEYGCALVVGCAYDSTIENCVSMGTISAGTHNVGGIVLRIRDTTVRGCVNKANITGSYKKVSGIVSLNQDSTTACLIENCVNEGALTAAARGEDGVAGIIAWVGDTTLTITGCENKGTLTGVSGSAVAQIVGKVGKAVKAVTGTNKGLAGTLAVGYGEVDGLNYATVADDVATYVKDVALAAGSTYLVTAKNAAPTIALAADESISFDTALATITATGITAAEGATLSDPVTVDTVTTYAAAAAATETYPEYVDQDDAEAKKKYDDWVEANKDVEGFDKVGEVTTPIWKDAFLLNVAPTTTAVEEATKAFKITKIEIAADGTVTVEGPSGKYNGTVEIKGSATVDGTFDLPQNDAAARFFKAFLK